MALKPREVDQAEGRGYVSTITAEDLAAYADGYADGIDSDEYEEENQYAEIEKKKTFGDKLTAAKVAIQNFSLPSPDEIKNSNFCKSFQQPLMVKTKVQSTQVQQSNIALTKGKTPAELSKISKISDFPLPSFKKHADSGEPSDKAEEDGEEKPEGFGYHTLPRSLRETKLITAVVESEVDDEDLIKRMEITKNATPAELSEIKSFKDIPIPDTFKHLLDKPVKPITNGVAHAETNGDAEEEQKASWAEGFLETKLVTNVKECTDYGTLKKRQDLTKNKTPAELAAMSGLGDLPVPSKIANIFSGGDKEVADGTSSQGFNMGNPLQDGIKVPESLKISLAVNAIVQDEEIVMRNKELIENKSVAELGKVTSISAFPVPEAITNLMKKKEGGPEIKASNLSLSAIASGKILPESIRETKLITNIKVEKDQERLMARQSIVRTQTPMELGSVKNLSDFPVPKRLQNLTHLNIPVLNNLKTTQSTERVSDYPTPPPRNKSCNASIYESLPGSLRNELVVNIKTETLSEEESIAKMEIIRSKSPLELSQIGSLKDVPIPKTIEKFFEPKDEEAEEDEEGASLAQKFSTLPASMKTNLLVGAKVEDQELVQQRSETIKAKSVVELSEIHSVSDIPLPSTLTRLAKRDYAPVERKKLFKQQMKSQSTQSLTNSLQSTLPRSLRETQLLVSSKVQDPEVLNSRKSLAEGKSIAELSKVTSFKDIPVPSFFSRMASKSMSKLNFASNGHLQDPDDVDSKTDTGIYATLPKSLNCELLVSKSIQDVSLLEERMQLVSEKSTKELARIGSMKDFPVPDNLRNFYYKSMERLNGRGTDDGLSRAKSSPSLKLPTMLTQPCIVKTKVEDPQVLLERQQIQQQKSIRELSKIRNLNELPIPGNLVTLPDVPLPKMKSILQMVARTPQRKASPSVIHAPQLPSEMSEQQYEEDSNIEDEYSNLEDSYEVISKEPAESPQVEVEPFGLASQIKGTPERNTRSKKKKPESKNRRSQMENDEPVASAKGEETPPPLPPKRSPQKSFSFDSQQSVETEESPSPVKGVLTLEAMNGNIQVIKNEVHGSDGIQSRPLPAPPAPVRYGRVKESDRTLVEESQRFQTCRESLTTDPSRTLIGTDDDDNTMADSIVESLVSCTDTLLCDDENDFDDDPYPSVNFEGGMSELQEEPPRAAGGKRLEEGTQQLSLELMQHVDSLRSTLDNMSNRLGARSRSRSNDRARSGSRPPSLYRQEK